MLCLRECGCLKKGIRKSLSGSLFLCRDPKQRHSLIPSGALGSESNPEDSTLLMLICYKVANCNVIHRPPQ